MSDFLVLLLKECPLKVKSGGEIIFEITQKETKIRFDFEDGKEKSTLIHQLCRFSVKGQETEMACESHRCQNGKIFPQSALCSVTIISYDEDPKEVLILFKKFFQNSIFSP